MNDNALINLIRTTVLARLASATVNTPMQVKQANQPTQQGATTTPALYLTKVGDPRVGWPQRADVWDEVLEEMRHVESVQIMTTFQFNADVGTVNPADIAALTASDFLQSAASALQSDVVLDSLRAAGVGVLRIGNLRNGVTVNDEDQFQSNPSFDAVFTHRKTTTEVIGAVNSREVAIYPV